MPLLACQDINQFLLSESGRLTYDIYRRKQYSSPWIALPKKEAWPMGIGDSYSNSMFERPYVENDGMPTGDEVDWEAITLNDGSGNACIPPIDIVKYSQTNRAVSLYQKAVQSEKFCVKDFLFVGKGEQQMANIEKGLASQVEQIWIKWNRASFRKLANKYIASPSLDHTDEADGEYFPALEPTSRLTNGYLDYFYNLLNLEGGTEHALSMSNGKPIYGLITDNFTSRFLIRGDDAIREDFRYADPDKLLGPLGTTHTYNGFMHMMDDAPDRYNFVPALAGDEAGTGLPEPGVNELPTNLAFDPTRNNPGNAAANYTDPWTYVPHYTTENNGSRKRKIVNPAWLTAGYQDSFIYVKDSYLLRVPGSITSLAGASFDTQKYMGDYTWRNVVNMDKASCEYNPDGTMGFFRGVLASGVEAINPHVMFVIRHKVCGTDLGSVGCPV